MFTTKFWNIVFLQILDLELKRNYFLWCWTSHGPSWNIIVIEVFIDKIYRKYINIFMFTILSQFILKTFQCDVGQMVWLNLVLNISDHIVNYSIESVIEFELECLSFLAIRVSIIIFQFNSDSAQSNSFNWILTIWVEYIFCNIYL